MMLTGFSEDEIEQIQLLLNGIVETRTHENTGLYILEEKANVDDSRNKPSIDN
jgi:hypothetical protein